MNFIVAIQLVDTPNKSTPRHGISDEVNRTTVTPILILTKVGPNNNTSQSNTPSTTNRYSFNNSTNGSENTNQADTDVNITFIDQHRDAIFAYGIPTTNRPLNRLPHILLVPSSHDSKVIAL